MSTAMCRVLYALPLLVILCAGGGAARPLFFNSLFGFLDPNSTSDLAGAGTGAGEGGLSLLQQLFSQHAQDSLSSLGELAALGQTFFQGK